MEKASFFTHVSTQAAAWFKGQGWLLSAPWLLGAYILHQMTDVPTAATFAGLALGLGILLLPLMGVKGWRDFRPWSTRVKRIIWWGYPLLIWGIGLKINDLPGNSARFGADTWPNQWGPVAVLGMALALEGMLRLQQHVQKLRLPGGRLAPWRSWLIALGAILAFWVLILPTLNQFQDSIAEQSLFRALGIYLSSLVQLLAIYFPYYGFYWVHHHLLFNQVLRKQGLLQYIGGLIICFIIGSPLLAAWAMLFPITQTHILHTASMTPTPFADVHFILPLSIVLLSLPLIVGIEWYKQYAALQTLEAEKQQAELTLLKQQINPHFFFNTLNNLYAMSLTRAAETPETILQLAELMRYVIYKGQNEFVPLADDWQYVQDYIDLQCIRLAEVLDFTVETAVDNWQVQIPPLLLIILVENAFKHGIEPTEGQAELKITLSQSASGLRFFCRNSRPMTQDRDSGGLGLENLRRRLDVRFADRYSLKTEAADTHFWAELSFPL